MMNILAQMSISCLIKIEPPIATSLQRTVLNNRRHHQPSYYVLAKKWQVSIAQIRTYSFLLALIFIFHRCFLFDGLEAWRVNFIDVEDFFAFLFHE